MSKIIWVIGSVITVVASAVSANWYADQKISTYYEQAQLTQTSDDLKIQYSNFNMNTFSGSADWVMTLALDPCKANDVLVLEGRDKIQKNWKGYQIDSTYVFKSGNEKAKMFLRGEQQANTQINWLGQSLTTVNVPKVDTRTDGIYLRLDPSLIRVYSDSNFKEKPEITKLEMDIPAFTMVEGRNQILAQGLKLETTQGLGDAVFDSGKTRFLITSFQRLDSDLSGGIKNLEMLWDTRIDKNKVAVDSTFKIGELSVPHSPVAKDIVMNLEMKNINLQRLQEFTALLQKSKKSCVGTELLKQEASNAFLKIINDGFDFSSNNQMSVGSGTAKANLTGKIMPGHHGSVQAFGKMLPSLLSFKAELEFDKNLFKTMSNGFAQATSARKMTDQDIENMFSSLESSGQAKRSGDHMKMLLDYQFGQKMFLKPDQ